MQWILAEWPRYTYSKLLDRMWRSPAVGTWAVHWRAERHAECGTNSSWSSRVRYGHTCARRPIRTRCTAAAAGQILKQTHVKNHIDNIPVSNPKCNTRARVDAHRWYCWVKYEEKYGGDSGSNPNTNMCRITSKILLDQVLRVTHADVKTHINNTAGSNTKSNTRVRADANWQYCRVKS